MHVINYEKKNNNTLCRVFFEIENPNNIRPRRKSFGSRMENCLQGNPMPPFNEKRPTADTTTDHWTAWLKRLHHAYTHTYIYILRATCNEWIFLFHFYKHTQAYRCTWYIHIYICVRVCVRLIIIVTWANELNAQYTHVYIYIHNMCSTTDMLLLTLLSVLLYDVQSSC